MITERDERKCKATQDLIEASNLNAETKSDLIDCIQEAKQNLNGRTIEERVRSIAQNQFDTTRFLAEILIDFKTSVRKNTSWKDVVLGSKWQIVALGSIIAICSIFQPQICKVIEVMLK